MKLDQRVTTLFLTRPEGTQTKYQQDTTLFHTLWDKKFRNISPSDFYETFWERILGIEPDQVAGGGPNQMYQHVQRSSYGYGIINGNGEVRLCDYRAVLGAFTKYGVEPSVREAALGEFKDLLTGLGLQIEGEITREI